MRPPAYTQFLGEQLLEHLSLNHPLESKGEMMEG